MVAEAIGVGRVTTPFRAQIAELIGYVTEKRPEQVAPEVFLPPRQRRRLFMWRHGRRSHKSRGGAAD